jgi:peptide/nickel transport system substrate-binding protein
MSKHIRRNVGRGAGGSRSSVVEPFRSRRAAWRSRAIPALCLVAASIAIAACGGSDTPSAKNLKTGEGGSTTVPRTLKIAFDLPPNTLYPPGTGLLQSSVILSLISSPLTTVSEGSRDAEPALAASLDASADGRTYTVKLRPNLTYSDGSPITSADVKASIGHIKTDRGSVFASYFANVAAIDTPDAQTVVFRLSQPSVAFPQILAMPFFGIFPKAGYAKGEAYFKAPVSSGPYVLRSFDANGRAVMTANDNYYGGPRKVKRIEVSVVGDPGTRLAQVKTGQVQLAYVLPGVLVPQVTGKAHVLVNQMPGTFQLIQNLSGTLGDVKLRQAINLAVDRQQIANAVFGGVVEPQTGYFPAQFSEFSGDVPSVTRDVEKAKALLRGTRCADGCKLSLVFPTDVYWGRASAAIVQQNLRDIGITTTMNGSPTATANDRLFKGEFDLVPITLTALTSVPDPLMQLNLDPGGVLPPMAGYKSPQMHDLVQQFLGASSDERPELGRQIEALFSKELPIIPLSGLPFISATSLSNSILKLTYASTLSVP